jgi:hypothetical protein
MWKSPKTKTKRGPEPVTEAVLVPAEKLQELRRIKEAANQAARAVSGSVLGELEREPA